MSEVKWLKYVGDGTRFFSFFASNPEPTPFQGSPDELKALLESGMFVEVNASKEKIEAASDADKGDEPLVAAPELAPVEPPEA